MIEQIRREAIDHPVADARLYPALRQTHQLAGDEQHHRPARHASKRSRVAPPGNDLIQPAARGNISSPITLSRISFNGHGFNTSSATLASVNAVTTTSPPACGVA